MPQVSYFKITKNVGDEHDRVSLTSSLKRWQLYDRETSVSFFYSEIEGCWLVRVNSGSCRIDDQLVYSHSESAIVVEKHVNIVINGISFKFTNLGHAKGISKMLVHTLLKRTNFKVKMETVLGLIYENCNCYLDFYFVLDAIRKNRMFVYRCDEIMLDIESLYFDTSRGKSPIIESLKYEAENRVLRDKIRAFNIIKIWTNSDFEQTSQMRPTPSEKWPSSKTLYTLMQRIGESSSGLSKELLPSPQSSCRYINSYRIKKSSNENVESRRSITTDEDVETSRTNETDSPYSITGIFSHDEYMCDSDERICGKRKQESSGEKRLKSCFEVKKNPVEELIGLSSDSEQSVATCASDALQSTLREPRRVVYRSASCVEDGFLCERYDESMYAGESDRRGRHATMARHEWHKITKP